jgi:hypothetical protein
VPPPRRGIVLIVVGVAVIAVFLVFALRPSSHPNGGSSSNPQEQPGPPQLAGVSGLRRASQADATQWTRLISEDSNWSMNHASDPDVLAAGELPSKREAYVDVADPSAGSNVAYIGIYTRPRTSAPWRLLDRWTQDTPGIRCDVRFPRPIAAAIQRDPWVCLTGPTVPGFEPLPNHLYGGWKNILERESGGAGYAWRVGITPDGRWGYVMLSADDFDSTHPTGQPIHAWAIMRRQTLWRLVAELFPDYSIDTCAAPAAYPTPIRRRLAVDGWTCPHS